MFELADRDLRGTEIAKQIMNLTSATAPTYENALKFRRQEICSHGLTLRQNQDDEGILFDFFNKDYVESRKISIQDIQAVDQETKVNFSAKSAQRIERLLKPAKDQPGSRWCHISQHDKGSLNSLAKVLGLGKDETAYVVECDGWEVRESLDRFHFPCSWLSCSSSKLSRSLVPVCSRNSSMALHPT